MSILNRYMIKYLELIKYQNIKPQKQCKLFKCVAISKMYFKGKTKYHLDNHETLDTIPFVSHKIIF